MVTSYAVIGVAWLLLQAAPPAKRVGLIEYLRAGYAGVKADLTAAAESMPEADYGFKPSSMPEVRTFGETIAHVASAQMRLCTRLRGMPDETPTTAPTNKAEVLKVLAASFASCDAVFASVTEATSSEFIPQGPVEIPKSAALVGLLAHNAEMYGIATVYLRAKNIVPPSTARQKGNDLDSPAAAETLKNGARSTPSEARRSDQSVSRGVQAGTLPQPPPE